MKLSSKRAIFFDKDGTLNYSVFWKDKYRAPRKVSETFFYKGLTEKFQILNELDFLIFLVTNQPDISNGDIDTINYSGIVNHIKKNFDIVEVATCVHPSKQQCLCRKPSPKMLFDLSSKHNIELKNSWMIGDRISDIKAGKLAGCKTILIRRESDVFSMYDSKPDHLASSTSDAILRILEEHNNS
jgi:D-glycero-D-manno-heptose 1,7-bisphosphate phosphatase